MTDDALFRRATCSALVISCSDFRFKTAERAFAEALGLADDYDLIARPGAIRSLVAPRSPAARETMEQEIRMLWNLHGFPRVLMVNHMSCGAYADLVAGNDERALHERHLRAAGGEVSRVCDGVKAEPYLLQLVDGRLRALPVNVNGEQ